MPAGAELVDMGGDYFDSVGGIPMVDMSDYENIGSEDLAALGAIPLEDMSINQGALIGDCNSSFIMDILKSKS